MSRSTFIRTSSILIRPNARSSCDLGEALARGVDGDAVRLGDLAGRGVEGEAEHAEQVDVPGRDRLLDRVPREPLADRAVLRAERDADAQPPPQRCRSPSGSPTAWM